jgi:hypothetical protein
VVISQGLLGLLDDDERAALACITYRHQRLQD